MHYKKKYAVAGFLFVLPSFLYYLLVFLYPLLLSFKNSFSEVNILMGTAEFIKFENYQHLFERVDFLSSIKVTVLFVLMSVPLILVVDLMIANLLSAVKGRTGKILITLSFLPFLVSMVSAGMIWDWLFDPNLGLINAVLRTIGISNPPLWLRDSSTALLSTVIITLWVRAPFGILIILGGIKNVPSSLYEASNIDGCTGIDKFFKITLPLINPQIVMVLTLEIIFAFKAFDSIYAATAGGPAGSTKTVMIYMIKDLFHQDYGMASALTVLLLVVLVAISLFQQLVLRKKVEY